MDLNLALVFFPALKVFFLHDFLYGFNYRPMIDVVGKKMRVKSKYREKKFAQKLMLVHMFVLEWFLHIQMCTKYDNECFECESNINFFPYFFLWHQLHYAFQSNKNRLFPHHWCWFGCCYYFWTISIWNFKQWFICCHTKMKRKKIVLKHTEWQLSSIVSMKKKMFPHTIKLHDSMQWQHFSCCCSFIVWGFTLSSSNCTFLLFSGFVFSPFVFTLETGTMQILFMTG